MTIASPGGTYIGNDMKLHDCECSACERLRCNALRELVREVIDAAEGDIRRDPGPSEILAESGWYARAKSAIGER